jgi:hypothetical protein
VEPLNPYGGKVWRRFRARSTTAPSRDVTAVCVVDILWYYKGMKTNTKSSITLPAAELARVVKLQKTLGAASKVDVVRRGLRLLEETTQRAALRRAYAEASQRTRRALQEELEELDGLTAEGLGE